MPQRLFEFPAVVHVGLSVGVTGHRDLLPQDAATLKAQVSSVLSGLSSAASAPPVRPTTLLTGLAEGADRWVTQWALDAGWRIGAVSALPPAAFEPYFEANAGSVTEFRTLLARCAWVHVASAPGTPRPDCCEAVGEWICQHAHSASS